MKEKQNTAVRAEERFSQLSLRSFFTAFAVIGALMIAAFVLGNTLPGCSITFGQWVAAPLLLLGADDNLTVIAILVFLAVIGGVSAALRECGLMQYLLDKLVARYAGRKYQLMAVLIAFFMGMGALIGSFEECIPLVPLLVALSLGLGWDRITGLSISMLSVGVGFAAGVFNPFTVGIAQQQAGLPMFSGVWFRLLTLVLLYGMMLLFVWLRAKKLEKHRAQPQEKVSVQFVRQRNKDRALWLFAGILSAGFLLVLSSTMWKSLQAYTMIIVAVAFLLSGNLACVQAGLRGGKLCGVSLRGILDMLPALVLILLAASIKYTMQQSGALTQILQQLMQAAAQMPRAALVLFLYLVVLVMNFFVPSGSAKVVMMMPIILPVAANFGISAQLCIMTFAFADGASDVLFPTSPVLLISLGVSGISYGQWAKQTLPAQLAFLVITALLLMFGLLVGY